MVAIGGRSVCLLHEGAPGEAKRCTNCNSRFLRADGTCEVCGRQQPKEKPSEFADCTWRTIGGRAVCITSGHGRHGVTSRTAAEARSAIWIGGRVVLLREDDDDDECKWRFLPGRGPVCLGGGHEHTVPLGTINPETHKQVLQPVNDVGKLLTRAQAAEAEYNARIEELAHAVPGHALSGGARVKKEGPRLYRKLVDRQPQEISDYLAGRVVFDRPADIDAFVEDLKRKGFKILDDDDFLEKPKIGYRARHLQVYLKGKGISAELALVPVEIWKVQEEAHKYYEVIGDANASPEAKREAMAKSIALFEGAWAKQPGKKGRIYSESGGALKALSVSAEARGAFSTSTTSGRGTSRTQPRVGPAQSSTTQSPLSSSTRRHRAPSTRLGGHRTVIASSIASADLIEADGDECRWRTIGGSRICLTPGHGKHTFPKGWRQHGSKTEKERLANNKGWRQTTDTDRGRVSKTDAERVARNKGWKDTHRAATTGDREAADRRRVAGNKGWKQHQEAVTIGGRRVLLEYNPDQPRISAGSPDGGQWASGSGGSAAVRDSNANAARPAHERLIQRMALSQERPPRATKLAPGDWRNLRDMGFATEHPDHSWTLTPEGQAIYLETLKAARAEGATTRLKISDAQMTALQSAIPMDDLAALEDDDRALVDAIKDGRLHVTPATRDRLASILNDLSNAADERAQADPDRERQKWHRADARVLANLYSTVLRAKLQEAYNPDQPRVPAGSPEGGQW